jgi:prophage antirepressor-like protein
MNQNLSIIPFDFNSHEVRVVIKQEDPWFVATDIADALGYSVAKDMTRNLDDDEKGRHIVPTPGGDQELLVINESGLYHAIFKSRKPATQAFRKWVTSEVLPQIRRTGRYEPEASPEPEPKRIEYTVEHETITEYQKLILRRAMFSRIPAEDRKLCWQYFNEFFRIKTYSHLPKNMFDEAVDFIVDTLYPEYLLYVDEMEKREADAKKSQAS